MSELKFDKQRAAADVTLSTGTTVSGCFFVAGSTVIDGRSERVGDLLNSESGFLPFERPDGTVTLYNRLHIVMVTLPAGVAEAESDPGYAVAVRRSLRLALSTGASIGGTVAVQTPPGYGRLSDYARSHEQFRYVVTPDRTLIVNASHIVELTETVE